MNAITYFNCSLLSLLVIACLACSSPPALSPIEEINAILEELPAGNNPDYPNSPQQFSITTHESGDSIYITQRGLNPETGEEDEFYLLFTIISDRLHPGGIYTARSTKDSDLLRLHLIMAENEIGVRIQHMGPDGPAMSIGMDRAGMGAWLESEHGTSVQRIAELLQEYARTHGDPDRLATPAPSREPFDPWAEEADDSIDHLLKDGEAFYQPFYQKVFVRAYDAIGTELEASFSDEDYARFFTEQEKIDPARFSGFWVNYDEGALEQIQFIEDFAQFLFSEDQYYTGYTRFVATENAEGTFMHLLFPSLATKQIEVVRFRLKLVQGDQRMVLEGEGELADFELRLQKEEEM